MVKCGSAVSMQALNALWSQDIMVFLVLLFPGAALHHFPIPAEALKHYVNETAGSTNTCRIYEHLLKMRSGTTRRAGCLQSHSTSLMHA